MSVRDQLVGPWQVPVADVAITASGFESSTGEAMAMGERTPIASVNAAASGRMAVGEAVTNIAAAAIGDIEKIRLSANWMAASGHPGEDANLFDTVKAIGDELCSELGIAIPVGKDSMSMRTRWQHDGSEYQVVAPVSLIISAFAPVSDVRRHLTPQLKRLDEPGHLILIDLGEGANRLGCSVLAQVYNRAGGHVPDLDNPVLLKNFFRAIQLLSESNLVEAYHDRSDGGLLAVVAEMMFAGHMGANLKLAGSEADILSQLFCEELGAVLQVRDSKLAEAYSVLEGCGVAWVDIGMADVAEQLSVYNDDEVVLRLDRIEMQRAWSETSYRIQSLRDNPETAREEFDRCLDADDPGLNVQLNFDPSEDIAASFVGGAGPRVAILREQGVNSQFEMAAAIMRAGFDAIDVHMSDLLEGRTHHCCSHIGMADAAEQLSVYNDDEVVLRLDRIEMQRAWSETSYRIQSLRDNPETAREEFDRCLDADDPGLNVQLNFDPSEDIAASFVGGAGPRVAILREQGVNSQFEMAAAIMRAGFDAIDVHMSDLLEGRDSLSDYHGLIACGGFSFGDVLGAGGGWAKSVLFNPVARDQFAEFFQRDDSFALGVCNGCQMMSHLKELIPGAQHWPAFLRNKSEQFEARLSLVEVTDSPSIFLSGMAGCKMPIVTSHGEGRATFASGQLEAARIALRYVDNYGSVTDSYPANPNGSIDGVCGLSTDDGRVTIMMPHPERVARTIQHSWHPEDWADDGPWMRMFRNARVSVG